MQPGRNTLKFLPKQAFINPSLSFLYFLLNALYNFFS